MPSARSPPKAATAATRRTSSTGPRSRPTSSYLHRRRVQRRGPVGSDYTGQQIYYQSVRRDTEDFLAIRDYLWRWDTDWFWCSRPFGSQKPLVRIVVRRAATGARIVYRKLVALDRRYGLTMAALTRSGNLPSREAVIRDVEIRVERGAEFLRYFAANAGMSPVWMCPAGCAASAPGPSTRSSLARCT